MSDEKIKVRVTESGQTIEVVVLNKRADRIEIVIGEGVHSVRCELTPTRNALAYVGNAMGREIVYERTRADLKADIDRVNPTLRILRLGCTEPQGGSMFHHLVVLMFDQFRINWPSQNRLQVRIRSEIARLGPVESLRVDRF